MQHINWNLRRREILSFNCQLYSIYLCVFVFMCVYLWVVSILVAVCMCISVHMPEGPLLLRKVLHQQKSQCCCGWVCSDAVDRVTPRLESSSSGILFLFNSVAVHRDFFFRLALKSYLHCHLIPFCFEIISGIKKSCNIQNRKLHKELCICFTQIHKLLAFCHIAFLSLCLPTCIKWLFFSDPLDSELQMMLLYI